MMMRRRVWCGIVLSAVCSGFAADGGGKPLVLAARGRPAAYEIALPAGAVPSQRYAASEFSSYVAKITGVRLPVAVRPEGVRRAGARPSVRLVFDAGMGDAFALRAEGRDVVVSGGARGVLYGVYELLETYGGAGWFASWHEVVPEAAAFAVPAPLDRSEKPAFDLRESMWYDSFTGDFAARLRFNGDANRIGARHGGNTHRFSRRLRNSHTFSRLVPPDEFFDTHPEYFSMIGGRRTRTNSQLCLTNPDVLKIVVARVLDAIRKEPDAKYFGVSQNDCRGWCECPACKAVDDEEGSHAGTMIRFVNAVAAEVEKTYPDKVIETLAYQYTRKPPAKTRVRHNVMPCLCTIECDFSRPLDDGVSAVNARLVRDLAGWGAQTDRLYVWNYAVNFRHYPHAFPNVGVLRDNLRFFRDNHVTSVFELGDYQGRHACMAELKTWLLAKWMWNPDLPAEPLLERFFTGYYGKAAPFARRVFDETHAAQRVWSDADPARKLGIFDDVASPALSDAFLARCAGLWRQAEAAVKDEPSVYRYNVRMSAFSTAYTRFCRRVRANWATRHPERFVPAGEAVRLARFLRGCLDEARDIRIAEASGRTENFREHLDGVIDAGAGSVPSDVAVAHASAFQPGLGRLVKDAKAERGLSVELPYRHSDWCAKFQLNTVAYDPGVDYAVGVRLRAELVKDAPPEAEVFWAGVYDAGAKRGLTRGLSLKVKDVKDGWAWYGIGTIRPNDDSFVWIAPGRFERSDFKVSPAHRGVWVDAVKVERR